MQHFGVEDSQWSVHIFLKSQFDLLWKIFAHTRPNNWKSTVQTLWEWFWQLVTTWHVECLVKLDTIFNKPPVTTDRIWHSSFRHPSPITPHKRPAPPNAYKYIISRDFIIELSLFSTKYTYKFHSSIAVNGRQFEGEWRNKTIFNTLGSFTVMATSFRPRVSPAMSGMALLAPLTRRPLNWDVTANYNRGVLFPLCKNDISWVQL